MIASTLGSGVFVRYALIVGSLAVGCSSGQGADAVVAPPVPHVPYFEGDVLKIPPAFEERIGLELAAPEVIEIAPVAEVTGTVGFNARKVAAVGSRIQGRIAEILTVEGDQVVTGQVLAMMESAELGTAQAEVMAAEARVTAAGLQEQRRRQLLDAGVGSKRGAEEATEEASVARAQRMAAVQRVQALAGGKGGKGGLGLAPLRTPIGGQVIQLHVARGQAVAPSQAAFTIADLSEVWVELAVFERDLPFISLGDSAKVTLQGDPTQAFDGRIAHIGAVLDPETRSAQVRVVVPNPNRELRIGQAVRARIALTGEKRKALTVPNDAIIRVDGNPTVFVSVGEHAFVPRAVEVGVRDGTRVEIKKGLEASERFVVKGTFALKSEVFR